MKKQAQSKQVQTKPRNKKFDVSDSDVMDAVTKNSGAVSPKEAIKKMMVKKPYIKYKTENQKKYAEMLKSNAITFCTGPAGTGKSYIAAYHALSLLFDQSNNYIKLYITKPAVEIEKIGFLPGGVDDKMGVYTSSTFDIISHILGQNCVNSLLKEGIIEILPLAYIRGKTLGMSEDTAAICIFEEVQNMSPHQIKTVLTRIGHATYIMTGDSDQSDVYYRDPSKSGLADAIRRLQGVEGIGFFEFTDDDVVRNPIIKKILERYKNVTVDTKPN